MPTLTNLSSPEFAVHKPELAFVPVGATEQHGPNLALGVDFRIAEELAARASERCARRTVVAPPIPFGLSDHHREFPGTISISFNTFRAVCVDVALGLVGQGIARVVFVNGHMGNMNALGVITTELKYRHGIATGTAFWMHQAKDAVEAYTKTPRWGHACEIECSVAQALTPELVRADALEPGDMIEEYSPYTDNYEPFSLSVPLSFSERTHNGAFGDATQMSAPAGEAIVEAAVRRLSEFADTF